MIKSNMRVAIEKAIEPPVVGLIDLLRGITAEQRRTNDLLDEMISLQRAGDPRSAALVAFERAERPSTKRPGETEIERQVREAHPETLGHP